MPKKPPRPLDKILDVRSRVELFIRYGDHALGGKTIAEFMPEVSEALGYLMDFRNMVNAMSSLDEAPSEAVLPYLSNDALDAVALYRTDRDG
jgi:hypothetical protein